jgi:hypothetical protein
MHTGAARAGPRGELLVCRAGAFHSDIETADIDANLEFAARVGRLRQKAGGGRTDGCELRLGKASHVRTSLWAYLAWIY